MRIEKLERLIELGEGFIEDEKEKWLRKTTRIYRDWELAKKIKEGVGSVEDLPDLTPSQKRRLLR